MTLTNKILIAIIALLGVAGLTFFFYERHILNQKDLDIQNSVIEMKQLKDDIVRSQSQYVNQKGFEDFVKANQLNLNAIQKDISSLGGKIDAVNVAVASSQLQNGTNISSNNYTPTHKAIVKCTGDNCVSDPYNYFGTVQSLQLNEQFGKLAVPLGTVSFSAGSEDNKPWSYMIPARQYQVSNTIAHSATGQTVVYNSLQIKEGDQTYNIPFSSSKTVEQYPSPSFSWWNPRVAGGVSGSVAFSGDKIQGEVTPSISVSIMSYGNSKLNPDLRFLSIGAGYNIQNRAPAFEFSPIMVNVGKEITGGTFFSNVWLGPVFGVDTKGQLQAGAGLQIGF